MILLPFLLAAQGPVTVSPEVGQLPADQRAAAARLLAATGANERRGAYVDEVEDKALVFSNMRCAAVANGGHPRIVDCAEQSEVGRMLLKSIEEARPALLVAIADVQERAYAKRLSIADMDAMSAFARTPAGAHFFVAAQPAAIEANEGARQLILRQVQVTLDRAQAHMPKADTVTDPNK